MIYYIVWFLAVGIYSPIFFDLYQSRWESIDYTHAYFILPVSLWIAWQKKGELTALYKDFKPQRADISGLISAVIGIFMFTFGWRQGYLFVSTLSLLPVLWGITRYLYGAPAVRTLRFPILYLLFLIPPPLGVLDLVTLPMRYGISHLTEIILRVMQYPVERSGLMLTVGGHEIFMGAPCSGFRSLVTMFALAIAYVYFVKGSYRKKLIMVPAVIPFALFGNLVRVLALCLITYYFGQEVAEGFFHYFSGAVIFLIMIGCLMILEHVIERSERKQAAK